MKIMFRLGSLCTPFLSFFLSFLPNYFILRILKSIIAWAISIFSIIRIVNDISNNFMVLVLKK